MKELFDLGVDKVSINTSAVSKPGLVREASKEFGKGRLLLPLMVRRAHRESLPQLEVVIKSSDESTGMDIRSGRAGYWRAPAHQ